MNLSGKLCFLSLFFLANSLFGQNCPPGGALFVNEVYNDNGSATEYMELVVLGDPAAPTAPVNLEGWIIDDNNFVGVAGQGTATGHLKLDANFSSVNPGAIILIYHENFPYPTLPLNNPPWLYVVNGSDLDGCSASPSNGTSNPDYVPCGTPGGSWDYTQLNNTNDLVQTRQPDATFYHGVDWGPPMKIVPSITVEDKTVSLDCGDWFDPDNYSFMTETPGDFNTELNEALIMAIRNGTLDCDNIEASCQLFTCPEIADINFVDEICENESFGVTATGLAFMNLIDNAEANFGINFVLFDGGTPPSDPYLGGTSIGVVGNDGLGGAHPDQTATINTSIADDGTYQICAILDPQSAEPDCKPYACKTIQINDEPIASLSGYQLFCPGDCFEINVVITGGQPFYSVDFLLEVGPISFPLNIPSYDVNNKLTICYDASGFIPTYDGGTNTLHFPTFITGSGTIQVASVTDDNGCSPEVISPDFLTLDFRAAPDINPAGPLEACDENDDGMAYFDLSGLDNVLNGGSGDNVIWYEDLDATIVIDDPTDYYSEETVVYARVEGEFCLSEIVAVQLIVVSAPFPGEDTEVNICSQENTTLNFYAELGGEPGGIWSDDSGSGVDLSDPGNVDFTGIAPGTYLFSYTFLAIDPCPEIVAVLTVHVNEMANPGNDNSIGICIGSDSPIDLEEALGDHDANGTWIDLNGTGVDLSDPTQVDFSMLGIGLYDFEYSVQGIEECPDQSAIITINIYAEPNPGTDNNLVICNIGDTLADFDFALGPHDNIGFWTDFDGAGVELYPDYEVNFSGVAPGIYQFTYTIPESDNCPEVFATLSVEVLAGVSAGQDGSIQFCQGYGLPIDLFDLITGESNASGAWSQTTGTPVDLSNPNEIYIDPAAVGNHVFLYEIGNACGIDSSFVLLEILSALQAGSDYTLEACAEYDTINLFDSLGFYNDGGIWFNEEMDTIQQPDSLVFLELDTLYFQYIVGSQGICDPDTALATIILSSGSSAGQDSTLFVCEGSNQLLSLFDLIPGLTDSTGIWQQISGSPLDLSKPDSINLSGEPIGTDSLWYIIDGSCRFDTALLVINIDDAPSAGDDYDISVCETLLSINLYDSLQNYNPGGSWFDQSGDPIIDPEFVILNNPGNYIFSYIIPASGTCNADTAYATFTVDSSPDAGIDANINACEGASTNINLLNELGGTPDNGGNWNDLDGTGLNLNNWEDIDFSSVSLGVYRFSYIVEPTPGSSCIADTSLITVNITEAPNAGTDNNFRICGGEAPVVNLDSLLLDHDSGGEWIDLDGAGVNIDNPQQVSFELVNSGTYTFSYILAEANGCPESSALITIEVLESPQAGPDINLDVCEGFSPDIDLFDLLDPLVSTSGNWTDPNGTGLDLSDPGQVNISVLSTGMYTLQYVLTEDPECGVDIADLSINIEAPAQTGICDTVYICNGPSGGELDFYDILIGEDSGGFFRELTTSGVNLADPAAISFEGVVDGRYIFEYYFPGNANCPEVSTRIYVKVLASDAEIFEAEICPDESFTIGNNVYDLNNPTGTEYLMNMEGCDSIITVNLTPKIIRFEASHQDANCFDLGSINILGISGTGFPTWISNEDLGLIQLDNAPYVLEDIPAGYYEFTFTNDLSCSYDTSIVIEPFGGFVFELPDEVSIESGQAYQINPNTDMEPVSIIWFPSEGLDCSDCLSPVARPSQDTEYTVTLVDAEGCTLTGTILIRVEEAREVYIPNVFSPNGDEHNPVFYVQGTNSSATYSMRVFDRWGELVYKNENMNLNDGNEGWDGRFKGILLSPGVYVYLIEVRFADDEIQTFSGDVLLIR